MTAATQSRRAKGQQTRSAILEATLIVIVKYGHRAVTHRAVAAEAGVNVSLTTYYFRDLKQLISEAFALYRARVEADAAQTWQEVFAKVESFAVDNRDPEYRNLWVDKLAEFGTGYIVGQINQRPAGLILEMTFFYDLHLNDALRQSACEVRANFEAGFVRLCERLGSAQPQVDAPLLLGTLQRLEYQGLSAPQRLGKEAIYQQLRRVLWWIIAGTN